MAAATLFSGNSEGVQLKASVSWIPSNLHVHDNSFYYIHNSCAYVTNIKEGHSPTHRVLHVVRSKSGGIYVPNMTDLHIVRVPGGAPIIVVASVGTIDFLDFEGSVIGSYDLDSGDDAEEVEVFARGICHIKDGLICVGSSTGAIYVFDSKKDFFRNATLKKHSSAITALAAHADSSVFASADEDGNVLLWDASTLEVVHSFTSTPEGYVTAMAMSSKQQLWCGTDNGTLRCYDTGAKALRVEIAAHARTINAIALDVTGDHVVSVADDTRVLAFTTKAEGCANVFNRVIPNRKLVGAGFMRNGNLAVAAFDSEILHIFHK